MTIQAIISIAAIVITLCGAIVTHICVSVWWASKITTTLSFIDAAMKRVEQHQDGYYTKEEAIKENVTAAHQREALWKRSDEIRLRVEALEKEFAFMRGENK